MSSAFCILFVAAPCSAQRFSPKNSPAETLPYTQRTDAFRRMLYEFHFQPVADFAALQANPRQSILIVLGNTDCLTNGYFPAGLLPFVQQGGAVLVATDMEIGNPEARGNLVKLAGVTVTGQTLLFRGQHPYADSPSCPFAEPIADNNPLSRPTSVLGALASVLGAGGRPDLFHNPRPDRPDLRVATNAPSRLEVRGWFGLPGGIHRLARLPLGCSEELNALRRRPRRAMSEDDLLFAVGGGIGDGRVLVLADHSIFINRMILPRDTDNLEFTANCLHWLRGGVSSAGEALQAMGSTLKLQQLAGQRDKVLFWDDGRIRTDFEVPLKMRPLNPSFGSEPAVVAAIDQTLARMEDRDAFNEGLLDFFDDQGWWDHRMERYVLYLLTLAALAFAAYRLFRHGRYRPDGAVPALAQAVAQHEPRLSLLEQRRRALLREGNIWETVHQLARQSFESAGIPLTAAAPPRVVMAGGWWRCWRTRRRVLRLWQLARGETPARISPTALQRWLRELDELKLALANGTIQRT